jgi:hypothetical protein
VTCDVGALVVVVVGGAVVVDAGTVVVVSADPVGGGLEFVGESLHPDAHNMARMTVAFFIIRRTPPTPLAG